MLTSTKAIIVGSTAILFGLLATHHRAAQPSSAAPAHQSVSPGLARQCTLSELGRIPLLFEPNQGQAAPRFDFVAHGQGYNMALSPTRVDFRWNTIRRDVREPKGLAAHDRGGSVAAGGGLALELVGANSKSRPVVSDAAPGVVNYLIGRDPAHWQIGLTPVSHVAYPGIYPGIDLVYYGRQQSLEYDFVVAPRANPRAIRLSFGGANSVAVDRTGDLVITGAQGTARWHAPLVYQQRGSTRTAVSGRYVIRGAHHAGFEVARYDRTRPLIIDPVLSYSSYLGGSSTDAGTSIAVYTDSGNGHTYACVTGSTNSLNFPTANAISGADHPDPSGNPTTDAFVSKFDLSQSGSASLVYSTYLGGGGLDEGRGIAVDSLGRAYVTGDTYPYQDPVTGQFVNNFPADNSPNGGMSPNPQWSDAFVVVLSPSGSTLLFRKFLGGSRADVGEGITVDGSGNIYVTGYTDSFPNLTGYGYGYGGGSGISHVAFPTTASAYQTALADSPYSDQNPNTDAFVTRYGNSGSMQTPNWGGAGNGNITYSTLFGVHGADFGYSIAADSSGNAYIAGQSNQQGFAAKFNTGGSGTTSLLYSMTFSGYQTSCNGIAIDSSGCAYIAGTTGGGFPVTSGAFQTGRNSGDTSSAGTDAFAAKINAGGSALVYGTYLGGNGSEGGQGIAVDGSGNAVVTGYTDSLNFPMGGHLPYPLTANALQTSNGGGRDMFVTKLNPAGSGLLFSTYLGGSGDDIGSGVAVDTAGSLYVTGSTGSSNYPTTSSGFQTTNRGGSSDGFVTKIALSP